MGGFLSTSAKPVKMWEVKGEKEERVRVVLVVVGVGGGGGVVWYGVVWCLVFGVWCLVFGV